MGRIHSWKLAYQGGHPRVYIHMNSMEFVLGIFYSLQDFSFHFVPINPFGFQFCSQGVLLVRHLTIDLVEYSFTIFRYCFILLCSCCTWFHYLVGCTAGLLGFESALVIFVKISFEDMGFVSAAGYIHLLDFLSLVSIIHGYFMS